MIVAVPLFPSLVAVIVADPGPPPVTSPLADTVATAVLLLTHVTVRPLKGLPLASSGVAVSCWVPPTRIVAAVGLTLTDATGTATVIADVPLFPSLVAVIVAEPVATPVTRPFASTVATPGALVVQLTARPESGFPLASSGVAVSCWVPPTAIVAEPGLTATDATGTGFTVIADVPLFPSLVAVIVAEPGATAVTRPFASTVATPGALVVQLIVRPESGLPFASSGVAVSC